MPRKQEENALAVKCGFQCIQDTARGYGYCYFTKHISDNPELNMVVWLTSKGWMNAITTANNQYTNHKSYANLEDALTRPPLDGIALHLQKTNHE